VFGPEDNGDLATVYGFASHPNWRWTHGHVENVAAAIVIAALHSAAARRVYNVGEPHTPTMAERLARLPTERGDTRIRRRLITRNTLFTTSPHPF